MADAQATTENRARMVVRLHPVAERVVSQLEPHIKRQGYELVAVDYRKGTRSSLLRLLVDRPGGGISLSDLERLSPVLGDLLDVYDPIEGRYTLEVASPGINRPLMRIGDFQGVVGRRVRIRTHQAIDGQKLFVGVLVSVNDEGIELDDEQSRRRIAIGFGEMKGANYEHDFDGTGRQ